MQFLRSLFLAGIFAATMPAARANFFSFLQDDQPDIIANSDLYDQTAPTPSPGNPVYYLAVSKGYRQFGYEMNGEKVPDPQATLKMVTKILDGEGYKVASAEHPPSLIIIYSWGDFHLNPNPFAKTFATEMLDFLGAYKVSKQYSPTSSGSKVVSAGLTSIRPDASTIGGFLQHGMYVITFWGFDYARAMKGEAKNLWKTNISCSARGFYLPEVLPTMLDVGGPLIGKQTSRPIRIDISKNYTPSVKLGPLQVLEEDVKIKKDK